MINAVLKKEVEEAVYRETKKSRFFGFDFASTD